MDEAGSVKRIDSISAAVIDPNLAGIGVGSAAGLIGLKGRAQSEISNEGLVFVRGELWPAYSKMKIQRGETVFVKGFQGLALEVEPI